MNIYALLIIIILLVTICFVGMKYIQNKKRLVLVLMTVIIIAGFIGIGYIKFANNENYLRVNENNQEVSIKLKNHKEYYGRKFYRFSSFNSENGIIKELKENGYDAYYDQTAKKIIINYGNDIFEITMEENEKMLIINRYNYIFLKQENT